MKEKIRQFEEESCEDCIKFKGIHPNLNKKVCGEFGLLSSSLSPLKSNCFVPKENINYQIERAKKIERGKMPLIIRGNIVSGIIGGLISGIILLIIAWLLNKL